MCDYALSTGQAAEKLLQLTHPRGVRRFKLYRFAPRPIASTHAPRDEATDIRHRASRLCYSFNARTPCGVRPVFLGHDFPKGVATTHAPAMGCDILPPNSNRCLRSFNSRTPRGVRPQPQSLGVAANALQLTHPRGGVTVRYGHGCRNREPSTHGSTVGSDIRTMLDARATCGFNSRTPVMGATYICWLATA